MVKKPEMPIKQEKQLSSEFHMRMLQELESHHDEKSIEWSKAELSIMLSEARIRTMSAESMYHWGNDLPEVQRQLVHAANYLTIAWAILESRKK